ncbi:hypothetical protein NEHOM01_0580 [Nematocida homosporus]|uniref:uncharacterized protein n=1 Tax=Nematocida homosporus TaxID=1912981 RepID=UPI00221F1BB2|nr:uncharacterized protein NEHOM01_0580 [Nematocida homosporus]KAI5185075.1 hypothetical protein NEHOM01_0580 [Nematocida homosporus]
MVQTNSILSQHSILQLFDELNIDNHEILSPDQASLFWASLHILGWNLHRPLSRANCYQSYQQAFANHQRILPLLSQDKSTLLHRLSSQLTPEELQDILHHLNQSSS